LTTDDFILKLLKHIAENNVNIEDLTAQQVIDWFEQDGKIRRAGNCSLPEVVSNEATLILTIIVGTIAATGGQAMADQLNWQTEIPRKPNPQLKNRSSLRMTAATTVA